MPRRLDTEGEIILCTFIARFGREKFNESDIASLEGRSVDSIRMKVQNIASMLSEEGYSHSQKVSALTGLPEGETGRRTNWSTVSRLVDLDQADLAAKCGVLLAK